MNILELPYEVRKRKFRKRWTPLRYHPEQQRLIHSKARFKAVPAGRRSGKTDIEKRKLVKSLPIIKPWDDPRYFYAAPTEGQAKFLAWEDFKLLIPTGWLAEEPKQDPVPHFMTKFGSSLWIVGLDKPQRIEGVPWDGGVADESCDIKPKAIKLSIMPALTDRMGWLDRIGVPKRQGVGAEEFKEFCEKAEKGNDPDEDCFWWPSSDIRTEEELRYFQANMDVVDYDEQYNAQWQKMSGQIFHAYDEDMNERACNFDPLARMIVGCDFNVDPMCWVLGHPRDHGRYMEWFDEIHMRNTNTQKALNALWEKYGDKTHGTISFYGDSTAQNRHSSATKSDYLQIVNDKRFKGKGATVHFPAKNPDPFDRFSSCNAVLKNALGNVRCFFDKRMEYTLQDIKTRGFKEGTKKADDKKKEQGHPTDAWGYATFMLYPMGVDAPPPKIAIHRPDMPKSRTGLKAPRSGSIPKVRRGRRVRGRRR